MYIIYRDSLHIVTIRYGATLSPRNSIVTSKKTVFFHPRAACVASAAFVRLDRHLILGPGDPHEPFGMLVYGFYFAFEKFNSAAKPYHHCSVTGVVYNRKRSGTRSVRLAILTEQTVVFRGDPQTATLLLIVSYCATLPSRFQ